MKNGKRIILLLLCLIMVTSSPVYAKDDPLRTFCPDVSFEELLSLFPEANISLETIKAVKY